MVPKLSNSQFSKLKQSPALFLAYCALKLALGGRFERGVLKDAHSLSILVTPPGWEKHYYYQAAKMFIQNARDKDWVGTENKVYLIDAKKLKQRFDDAAFEILNAREYCLVIAGSFDDIPESLNCAADEILELLPPTPKHLNMSRRISGKAAFAADLAAAVAKSRPEFVLAALRRDMLSLEDFKAAIARSAPRPAGPSLFDLPGYEGGKQWARGVIADINAWRAGKLSWGEVRSNVLICGPPGVGKTMFASAFAGAASLELIAATIGKWQMARALDGTLREMRETFASANLAGGCVLFIDELDSIGDRSQLVGDPNEVYWRIVINEFLSLLSSVGPGVVIIGATNFPEAIDEAALRSGRIEERLILEPPDVQERADILSYHFERQLLPALLIPFVEHLEGVTGADLERFARRAKANARRSGKTLSLEHVEAALPPRAMRTFEELFRIAIHECGHAVAALSLKAAAACSVFIHDHFDPSAKSQVGGRTVFEFVKQPPTTEGEILDRITILLAAWPLKRLRLVTEQLGPEAVLPAISDGQRCGPKNSSDLMALVRSLSSETVMTLPVSLIFLWMPKLRSRIFCGVNIFVLLKSLIGINSI